jgi:hypothetical protein
MICLLWLLQLLWSSLLIVFIVRRGVIIANTITIEFANEFFWWAVWDLNYPDGGVLVW